MRIAYSNLVDSASSVTALTEDALFPVANVQNTRLAKEFRTVDITSQTVVVDLGAAATVQTAAIIGHNITTGATITLEGHTADSWTSPSVTTTLSANTGMILNYFSGGSYQYWRFTVNDATGGTAYISIGRLWLSDYFQFDPESLIDFTVTKHREDTVTRGRGGQKYATQGVGWREFNLSFPRTATTALNAVQTLYDTVGNWDSVIFSNFNVIRDYTIVEPVYCSIEGDINFRHDRSMFFTYGLKLQEDR